MALLTLKSIEGEGLPVFMAKRLSKALRGKRRWLGVAFPSAISSRSKATDAITSAFVGLDDDAKIRLMDFHDATADQSSQTSLHLYGSESSLEPRSYGILQVPHEIYNDVRSKIESEDALASLSIQSITSSGKIRLVRERMALAKPPRRR